MASPLISTKWHIPPAPAQMVARPQLLQMLDSARARPQRLILVSAPAGFGKTTLVAEWLRHTGTSAAWLELDPGDNDPARFWRHLIAAIQSADPSVGRSPESVFEAEALPPLKMLAESLVNDLDRNARQMILVLDDYHLIESDAIHSALNTLLDHLPGGMRIVITTRADPPLALSRLRSRDQITEARTADLRFTRGETAAFLNRIHQLDLAEEDVACLEERTEGWIAGLQLAAISLHRRSDRHAFVTAFAGDDRYIVDYLLQEVLAQQPASVRSFLLRTSILDRLCAPLCEAVTGAPGAEDMLRHLESSNLFLLPLDNRRYWYRYHKLFADLLRRRLDQELDPAERLELFLRAAEWFKREDLIPEAVSLLLAAPDHARAADLVERQALTVFFRSESGLLGSWLKSLPEELIRIRPLLCAVYANLLGHSAACNPSAVHSAESWLCAADDALEAAAAGTDLPAADPDRIRLTRSFIALSHAYRGLWRREDPQSVIGLAQQALAGLPPADETPADRNFLRIRSGLNYNLAVNYAAAGDYAAADRAFAESGRIAALSGDMLNAFSSAGGRCYILRRLGRLKEAAALCRRTMETLGAAGHASPSRIPYSGVAMIDLGLILLEWNELASAEESIRRGLELLQMTYDGLKTIEGNVALADIRLTRGDGAALSQLPEAEKNLPELEPLAQLTRVRLWLRQGALESALQWAKGRSLEAGTEREGLVLARIILACAPWIPLHGKSTGLPGLTALRVFLDRAYLSAEKTGWTDRMIELRILQTLVWQSDGESAKAVACLRQALAYARDGGYVRRFLDEGPPMIRLLGAMAGKSGELNPYIDRLLQAGGRDGADAESPASEPLIEPLSIRELDVLRLMAMGDSNAEIAQKLVITMNTTKKHVTHIFGKLDVTDRSKAVNRARELRLVA
ncbi:MAG: LuxR C-terminal-related transcriptional regulator [Anaerolineales bacterium]